MNLSTQKVKITVFELVLFSLLGALLYCGDVLFELLPQIHLVGVLTVVYTEVFRKKALIPISLYVLITLLLNGFSLWTLPYLYLWTVLWGVIMLVPKKISVKIKCIIYPVICALHGMFFGIMYAPAQAIMFGLNFEQTIAWIIKGLPWDIIHAAGNFAGGLLIVPLSQFLQKLLKRVKR